MHEESLVRDLRRKVDELSKAHGGAPIVRASVALGRLSHLDEPRLRELWGRTMADSAAEGARLDVEVIGALEDPLATAVVLRSVTFEEPGPTGRRAGRTPPPSPSSNAGP